MSLNHGTVWKVRRLLRSLKNKTSSATDQLDNRAVKMAADYIAGPLHHVITLSTMQEKFPSSRKMTKTVPLHKKNPPLLTENYRPVAILSSISRILEKVENEQMYNYFENNKIFHEALHGYMQSRSTMTALLSVKWAKAGPDLRVGTAGTCPWPPHFRGPHKSKIQLFSPIIYCTIVYCTLS